MREDFLEFVDQVLVLPFEAIDSTVFLLDVSLVFFDLVLEAVELVLLDVLELLQLSLSGALAALGLAFH